MPTHQSIGCSQSDFEEPACGLVSQIVKSEVPHLGSLPYALPIEPKSIRRRREQEILASHFLHPTLSVITNTLFKLGYDLNGQGRQGDGPGVTVLGLWN